MGLCASSPNADAVDTSKLENLVPEKKAPPRPGKQASTISAAAQVPPTAATQAVQPVHELHASKADKGPTDKGASNAVQDAFAGHIST